MDEICFVGVEYNLRLNCQSNFFLQNFVFVTSYKMTLTTSYKMTLAIVIK